MIAVWLWGMTGVAAELGCRLDQRAPVSWFDAPNEDPWPGLTISGHSAAWSRLSRSIERGRLPARGAVRPEELVQALDITQRPPRGNEDLAVRIEVAQSPWEAGAAVVRATLTGRRARNRRRAPAHVVFVVDQDAQVPRTMVVARRALHAIVSGLGPNDTVSIIGSTSGALSAPIAAAIDGLQPVGRGGVPEALEAGWAALQEAPPDALRRLILVSDGDLELLEQSEHLTTRAMQLSSEGIGLVGLGYGEDHGRDDSVEAIVQAAGGPLLHIAQPFDGSQIAQHLHSLLEPAARDVRVLVHWDERQVAGVHRVGNHFGRLTGLGPAAENVGGEIGVGQTATVLYEVRLRPGAVGPLGGIRVQSSAPGSPPRERRVRIPVVQNDFDDASPDLKISVAAASLGELLSGTQALDRVPPERVASLAASAARPNKPRDQALVTLAQRAAELLRSQERCAPRLRQ